jgi:potassium channel subfamily K
MFYHWHTNLGVVGLLWCVGAAVFWRVEYAEQQLSYFEALYFCYVSLLTIGYGDFAPKSNAGKPFFIVWSLVAVPTMTILISDMGDTVVASYKRRTSMLADITILPKQGVFREYLEKHPRLLRWYESAVARRSERKRLERGLPGPEERTPEPEELNLTLDQLASESDLDEHDLARKLAIAIRRVADDFTHGHHRRYSYEEWVEFSRLIRFSRFRPEDEKRAVEEEEGDEGLIEWDWIGIDSPMMADESECEWVLDRLCESLDRYMSRQVPEHVRERRKSRVEERLSFSSRGRRGSSIGQRPGTATGVSVPKYAPRSPGPLLKKVGRSESTGPAMKKEGPSE